MQPMDLTVCGVYKHHVQVAQEDATMKALEAALPPNIDTLSVEQLAEYIGQMPKGFCGTKDGVGSVVCCSAQQSEGGRCSHCKGI